jgi:hypothetical protein
MVEFFLSDQIEKLKIEMDKLSGIEYVNVIIKLGKLVNANEGKDYTYINNILAPIILNSINKKQKL